MYTGSGQRLIMQLLNGETPSDDERRACLALAGSLQGMSLSTALRVIHIGLAEFHRRETERKVKP